MCAQQEADGLEPVPATVIFGDIRNFTNILDIYGSSTISAKLNRIFNSIDTAVEDHDGTIEKLIGDGVLALFYGIDNTALAAIESLLNAFEDDLNELETDKEPQVRMGFGVATGPIYRIETNSIGTSTDSEWIGSPINLAARLEGLCKEYGSRILIDTNTCAGVSTTDVAQCRKLPSQDIRGFRSRQEVFECRLGDQQLDSTYLDTYNDGIRKFQRREFSAALSVFTRALDQSEEENIELLQSVTDTTYQRLQAQLQEPTGTVTDRYVSNSDVEKLFEEIRGEFPELTKSLDDGDGPMMVHTNCGGGEITTLIAEEFGPNIIGIDDSIRAVHRARKNTPAGVECSTASIESFPDSSFRIVWSIDTLQRSSNPKDDLRQARSKLAGESIIALQTPSQTGFLALREEAESVLEELNVWDQINDDRPYRLYNKEYLKWLIENAGFTEKQVQTLPIEDIGDQHARLVQLVLSPYLEQLDAEAKQSRGRQKFAERIESIVEEEGPLNYHFGWGYAHS